MVTPLHVAGWLTLAVSCAIFGCGGRSGRPATIPVRGTVTYNGEPVAGASVAFLAPGAPRPASGITDDSGVFRLTTFEENDGAVVGQHVVTVRKLTVQLTPLPPSGAGASGADMEASIEESMQQTAEQITAAKESESALPIKYGDVNTTDLRVEVVDSEENVVELELTD